MKLHVFEVQWGILIFSLFQGCTSSYQWRCSSLDTDNNKYYLPDFGGRTQVLGYTWESSINGATYIYDVDDNSLGCSGTVTAVEFCYTPPSSNSQSLREVFTLLTLRQQNNAVTVTNSISISFHPSSAECTSSRCCDVMTLMEQDQFDLPASNFVIGMTTKASPNLPGLHFGAYPNLQTQSSYQLSIGQPMINSMYPLIAAVKQSLRLMWFHITPFPETTTPPSMQQTTPSTTPSLVSSSRDMTSANTYTSMTPSTSAALATPEDTPSNDMKSANTHTSVLITTLGQSSVGIATGQPAGNNNESEVGGIIGVVMVFILIIFIVCMVLLFVLYRRKKYQSTKDVGEETIDNTVYDNINGVAENNEPTNELELQRPEYEEIDSLSLCPDSHIVTRNEAYNCILNQEVSTEQFTDQLEAVYIAPAGDMNALHVQLNEILINVVDKENISCRNLIGSGQFGDVLEGVLACGENNIEVAIKSLRNSNEDSKLKFLQEAAIMGQFKHPNVVTMYGAITDGEPIMIILEILKNGDLSNYLLSMKADDGRVSPDLDGHELLSYCRQVASGMVYLSNKAFVHRDLAARNILVSDDRICKIADFGMARDLVDENYYISNGGMIPVKWTAPEAICFKKYSLASDVWSFGIVLFEIWSIGTLPYVGVVNNKVLRMIESGYRLPPPPGCPRAIYDVMMSCWNSRVDERPSFSEVSTLLSVSNSKLLRWSEKDKVDFPEAINLGRDLSTSERLYMDLQTKYKSVLNTAINMSI